jgi:type VI protein secretion system component VasK
MADGYAPSLFLQVLAFWFILGWLLVARLVLFFGRILSVLMLAGLGTLDERRFLWAACFAGSALLAWLCLRRWRARSRAHHTRQTRPLTTSGARRGSPAPPPIRHRS